MIARLLWPLLQARLRDPGTPRWFHRRVAKTLPQTLFQSSWDRWGTVLAPVGIGVVMGVIIAQAPQSWGLWLALGLAGGLLGLVEWVEGREIVRAARPLYDILTRRAQAGLTAHEHLELEQCRRAHTETSRDGRAC